jgi:hypothetical protein
MKMKFISNNTILLITIILLLNNYIESTFVKNLKKNKRSMSRGPKDFDLEDKKIIIDEHNQYRNQIALSTNKNTPKLKFAQNMIQMYYSDAIHAKAQAWADKKKFMHSSSAYRKQPKYPCGENIFTMSMSGGKPKKNWRRCIKAWWDEIKNMSGKSVDAFSSGGPVTGHFTQVIWAHSYIVGCGFVQYNDGGWITQLYVCQYGPVANIMGMPIYKSGTTKGCKCDAGNSCGNLEYPGLCCEKSKCKKSDYFWPAGKEPYAGTVPQNLVG